MHDVKVIAAALGGSVFEQENAVLNFKVRSGCNPEGNIFQVREIVR